MDNINKTINSLNNKLDSIKSKSNLTEKDIKIINKGITNLRDNLKEYSNNNKLTDLTNKTVATVLRSTIKTVLSTPTSDSVSNPQVNQGIVGCLSNVNNCGSNRLTAFSQGNIGCSNMSEQGGQKFIFPNKIIDRN